MNAIISIAKYTIYEQIRNRLYLIILFFGGLLLTASILLGALAPGHRVRIIFDLGLSAIELFGLVTAVFGAVSLVLQEVESKTIYLILTRPVSRFSYLIGRFLGLVTAVFLTMVVMSLFHLVLIMFRPIEFKVFLDSVNFWAVYPTIILMSVGKMLITTAVALFFSIFATSAVSALVFTGFFWIAGHFGTELTFMINQSLTGGMAIAAHMLGLLIPNLQYFNFRDTFSFPVFPGTAFIFWAWLYGLGYTAFFLTASGILFSKKEF